MFSPPIYLSVGDEYDKPPVKSPMTANKAARGFVVPMKRSPHITDAVFQKPFISLAVGDEYIPVPPGGTFRQSLDDKKLSKVAPVPFRPPGNSHKPNGSGTYYGTFCESSPYRHEAELPLISVKKGADAGDAKTSTWPRRPIYTNPGKKGTYGYVGLTIGKMGEVCYVSDPVAQPVYTGPSSPSTQPPFRTAVKKGGCFDDGAHGFTTVYTISKPLPPKKPPVMRPPRDVKPWRPAGALVRDIIKPPEYQEDPYDLKEKRLRELRQKEQSYKPWCPAGNDPYRHIYSYPVRFEPPPLA